MVIPYTDLSLNPYGYGKAIASLNWEKLRFLLLLDSTRFFSKSLLGISPSDVARSKVNCGCAVMFFVE